MPAASNHIIELPQKNNLRANISAAMRFHNGQIIQLIEGETTAIDVLYARIAIDDRHTDVKKNYGHAIGTRAFQQ